MIDRVDDVSLPSVSLPSIFSNTMVDVAPLSTVRSIALKEGPGFFN